MEFTATEYRSRDMGEWDWGGVGRIRILNLMINHDHNEWRSKLEGLNDLLPLLVSMFQCEKLPEAVAKSLVTLQPQTLHVYIETY